MKKHFQSIRFYFFLGFVILPLFLGVLCFIINLFAPPKLKFPSPNTIFSELLSLLTEKKVLLHLQNTFTNVFIALGIATISGVFLGLLLGFNRRRWHSSQPTVDFFRSVPVTFLIPISALLFSSQSSSNIWLLASYPCMLIIILNVRTGLSKQETERVLSYCIISGSTNPFKKFFRVTLFEILPDISTGFRIALSYCIVIVTVLEYSLIGSSKPGVGYLVYDETNNLNYVRVYALIFLIGIIGFLLNKLTEVLDYSLLRWSKNNTNDN